MTTLDEGGQDRREYPERPILGVAGVVFYKGSVLLVQRGRQPLLGAWSLPGGALELGESIKAGVMREIFEETGVKVCPRKLVEVVERVVRDDRGSVQYHYVLHDWLCTIPLGHDKEPTLIRSASDARAAVWAPVDSLDTFVLDAQTLDVIRRGLLQWGELGDD